MTAPTQTRTITLHERCEELLGRHPIATRTEDNGTRSVVLRDPAGSYFVLTQNAEGETCYLSGWNQDNASAFIGPDDDSRTVPAGAVSVIKNAIPIPQDGTLLGWVGPSRRFITALIPVYVEYRPDNPQPSWAVLPHQHAAETAWPPFINGNLFCPTMWEAVQAGQLVSLGPVIAGTEDTVYWIEAKEADAPGFCDVDSDVPGDGFVLPAGKYADYDDLRRGMQWPDPVEVLDNYTVEDIAPRFW